MANDPQVDRATSEPAVQTTLPENAYRELRPGETYTPMVPAGSSAPEVTVRSIAIGLAMNVVFDDKSTDGVKLEEILAGGAAEKVGLEAGDVIVSFSGHKVKSADDLRSMLPSYKVGEKVKLEVDRGGHVMPVEIKLVEKPRD